MVFRRNFSVGREDELIAEIERLRAALEEIANGKRYYDNLPAVLAIARKALNGPTGSD